MTWEKNGIKQNLWGLRRNEKREIKYLRLISVLTVFRKIPMSIKKKKIFTVFWVSGEEKPLHKCAVVDTFSVSYSTSGAPPLATMDI